MTTAEVLDQVSAATEVIWQGTSPDVERMYNRKMAHNQSFTVMIFGQNAVDGTRKDCRHLVALLRRYGIPLADVKRIGRDLLAADADMFQRRYGLVDTAALIRNLSEALEASDDSEEWATALLRTADYLYYLSHAIAVHIPWHELSVAFEGVRAINVGLNDRLVR